MMLRTIFSLWILIITVDGNTFIWDPTNTDNIEVVRPFSRHSTFANPPRCVNIPANLTLCHGIKYNEMRLPNLLYHETLNEVIEQSGSWIQLIKIGCHPDTQLFLCSLFSPVCLDQTIPPCRSLCENVKKSCEPSMLRHGFNWPPMMQCDQFPIDNNMCIESQMMASINPPPPPPPPSRPSTNNNNNNRNPNRQDPSRTKIVVGAQNRSQNAMETTVFQKQLLEAICNSDWVIKMGLNQMRGNDRVRVKKYKLIFGNLNVQPPFTLLLNKSMIISDHQNVTIGDGLKPREKFVIVGKGGADAKNLSVRLVVSWLKNTDQLKKALKKAKTNVGCKKYFISSPPPSPSTGTSASSSSPTSSSATSQSSSSLNGSPKRSRNRNRKKNPNLMTRI